MNRRFRGMTMIEILIVMAIISILAAAVFPVSRMTVKRSREIDLKRNLRTIRTAIDKYKEMYDSAKLEQKIGASGYPPDLDILVAGVPLVSEPGKKIKLLRRIPADPMTEGGDWEFRSHDDSPDSRSWGGKDVFDVRSKSEETALDGTKYRDW